MGWMVRYIPSTPLAIFQRLFGKMKRPYLNHLDQICARGIGETPAYRGTAWTLHDWGLRLVSWWQVLTRLDPWDIFRYADLWAYEASVELFQSQTRKLSSEVPREMIELPKPSASLDRYTLYVMGPDPSNWDPFVNVTGMYWTTLPELPMPTPMTFYFTSNSQLSPAKPTQGRKFSYIYDPKWKNPLTFLT